MKNERTREILALGTLGVSAFLAAAMVSYHEDLPPAREPGVQNVCGPIGYAAARFLFHHLGLSAYLIVIALALEALRLWRGARYRSLLEKLPALLLFAVALSATLSKLCKGWTRSIPDPGGDVGIVVTSLIFEHSGLGPMGASLLLAFFLLTTFVLFSDLLVSSVVQSGLHWLLVRAGVPVDRRRAPAAGGREQVQRPLAARRVAMIPTRKSSTIRSMRSMRRVPASTIPWRTRTTPIPWRRIRVQRARACRLPFKGKSANDRSPG